MVINNVSRVCMHQYCSLLLIANQHKNSDDGASRVDSASRSMAAWVGRGCQGGRRRRWLLLVGASTFVRMPPACAYIRQRHVFGSGMLEAIFIDQSNKKKLIQRIFGHMAVIAMSFVVFALWNVILQVTAPIRTNYKRSLLAVTHFVMISNGRYFNCCCIVIEVLFSSYWSFFHSLEYGYSSLKCFFFKFFPFFPLVRRLRVRLDAEIINN